MIDNSYDDRGERTVAACVFTSFGAAYIYLVVKLCQGFLWGVGFAALLIDLLFVASVMVAQKGIYPQ